MNKTFKLVFNRARGKMIAVNELTKSVGKASSVGFLVAIVLSAPALALEPNDTFIDFETHEANSDRVSGIYLHNNDNQTIGTVGGTNVLIKPSFQLKTDAIGILLSDRARLDVGSDNCHIVLESETADLSIQGLELQTASEAYFNDLNVSITSAAYSTTRGLVLSGRSKLKVAGDLDLEVKNNLSHAIGLMNDWDDQFQSQSVIDVTGHLAVTTKGNDTVTGIMLRGTDLTVDNFLLSMVKSDYKATGMIFENAVEDEYVDDPFFPSASKLHVKSTTQFHVQAMDATGLQFGNLETFDKNNDSLWPFGQFDEGMLITVAGANLRGVINAGDIQLGGDMTLQMDYRKTDTPNYENGMNIGIHNIGRLTTIGNLQIDAFESRQESGATLNTAILNEGQMKISKKLAADISQNPTEEAFENGPLTGIRNESALSAGSLEIKIEDKSTDISWGNIISVSNSGTLSIEGQSSITSVSQTNSVMGFVQSNITGSNEQVISHFGDNAIFTTEGENALSIGLGLNGLSDQKYSVSGNSEDGFLLFEKNLDVNTYGGFGATGLFNSGHELSVKGDTHIVSHAKNEAAGLIDFNPSGVSSFSDKDSVTSVLTFNGNVDIETEGRETLGMRSDRAFYVEGNLRLSNRSVQSSEINSALSSSEHFSEPNITGHVSLDNRGMGLVAGHLNASLTDESLYGIETRVIKNSSHLTVRGNTTVTGQIEKGGIVGIVAQSVAVGSSRFDGNLNINLHNGFGNTIGIETENQHLTVGGNLSINVETLDDNDDMLTMGALFEASHIDLYGKTNNIIGGIFASNSLMNVVNNINVTNELTIENSSLAIGGKGDFQNTSFKNSTISLTTPEAKLNIDTLHSENTVLSGNGNVNDTFGGDLNKLLSRVQVAGKDSAANAFTELRLDEGEILGLIVGHVENDGTVTTHSQKNRKNTAKLNLTANVASTVTRVQMNELRKRLGDIRTVNHINGSWARVNTGSMSGKFGLDTDFQMIQAGLDRSLSYGLPRLGTAFSYVKTDSDDIFSSAESETWTIAGYGVWCWDNGLFADVIAQAGKIDTDLTQSEETADIDGYLWSVSGEFGTSAKFGNGFFVEPSAEFTYTRMKGDNFMLKGIKRELDDRDSLIGRFGSTVGMNLPNHLGDGYIRTNIVHEFMGDSAITSSNEFAHATEKWAGNDTWIEYAIGANLNINTSSYLYIDLERTEGADIEEDWRANIGFRHAF